MSLVLPHSGSGAVAYYRTFPSPAIAGWISAAACPGLTVVDVGAHVGVYTLLAARLVEPDGVVHAIEPQPDCMKFLVRNATLNELSNVRVSCLALARSDGRTNLAIDRRTMGAYLTEYERAAQAIACMSLETFARTRHLQKVDVMKLDAAGSELDVLRGGQSLFERGAVGRLVVKLYHPRVVAARTGLSNGPEAAVKFLRGHGYRVELEGGEAASQDTLRRLFSEDVYSVPALATQQALGTS